ncbi:hypothetical protein NKH71_26825 [Mesorhizobium sp. M0983]|uniref:hypothetical protein n=1 Tax=Mesorhizobium sp. M0983 TaxID=2957040 RepID=UPI00333A8320
MDIDGSRMFIRIAPGNGGKHRYVMLSLHCWRFCVFRWSAKARGSGILFLSHEDGKERFIGWLRTRNFWTNCFPPAIPMFARTGYATT